MSSLLSFLHGIAFPYLVTVWFTTFSVTKLICFGSRENVSFWLTVSSPILSNSLQIFITAKNNQRWFHTPLNRKMCLVWMKTSILSDIRETVDTGGLGERLENKFCCNCLQAALTLHDFYGHWFPWYDYHKWGSVPACQCKSAMSPLSPIQLQENARLSFQPECMGCAWCNHQCQQSTVPEAAPVKTLTGWRDGRWEKE